MVELKESKIEITKRLQRDGRWDAASQFRCDERRRLRALGRPRDEANEQAWESMGEKYPSDEDRAAAMVQAANSPPVDCGSPEVANAWYAFHAVLLLADIPDREVGSKACGDLLSQPPSEAVREMFNSDLRKLFDWVERAFTQEIERRRNASKEINDSVADELAGYVERLPALKEMLRDGGN